MLATLSDRRDFGDDWLLERKLDGERCVAHKQGPEVRLESRTGKDLSGTYPEVRDAIAAQEAETLLLDGEVVAYDGEQTSFSRLQQRLGTRSPSSRQVADTPVVFCVFDLLARGDDDLRARPLRERRDELVRTIRPSAALQLTEAWHGRSQARFDAACRAGWEGLIAKRADAPYAPGRSRDWLKLKCVWEQELVIGGYTDPAGQSHRLRRAARRLLRGRPAPLRGQGRHGLRSGDAAHARRAACGRSLPTSRRSPTRARCRAACAGRAPSSSRRSASPSGRTTGACGSRASSGCATTSGPRDVVRERPR